MREIFWEDFLVRNFLGGILVLQNSESNMIFEYERNLCSFQDFGVMQGGRRDKKFRSLEVRGKLIALKKTYKMWYFTCKFCLMLACNIVLRHSSESSMERVPKNCPSHSGFNKCVCTTALLISYKSV